MKFAHYRVLVIVLIIIQLSGCYELHANDTAVISFDKAEFPLKSQSYYMMELVDDYSLYEDFLSSHTTAAERKLLTSRTFTPIEKPIFRLTKTDKCYLVTESEIITNEYNGTTALFEKLDEDIYLYAVSAQTKGSGCVKKGSESRTEIFIVKIINNNIILLSSTKEKSSGKFNSDGLSILFRKWALGLNKVIRWSYDIAVIKDKDNKDQPVVSSTFAYKEFYKQYKNTFIKDLPPLLVGQSNLSNYKTVSALQARLKTQYATYEENKSKVKDRQKQIKKAKINDGVIRYAFGQELGVTKHSDHNTVTTWSINELVEKSPFFDEYIEKTTPTSEKVMSIYALSKPLTGKQCEKRGEKVMSFLEIKYGQADKYSPVTPGTWGSKKDEVDKRFSENYFIYFKRIAQPKNDRLVEVVCVTDSSLNKKIRQQYKANKCDLNDHYFDKKNLLMYGFPKHSTLYLSEHSLYTRYSYNNKPSNYGSNIVPFSFYKQKEHATLYPAPVYSKNYLDNKVQCNLKNTPTFSLLIRYADTALESLVRNETEAFKNQQKINSDEARGL